MTEKKLRRVQLKDGKFVLEKRVVEAEILKLDIIATGWDDRLEEKAPKGSNAYYRGGNFVVGPADFKITPILYLRLNQYLEEK